MIGKAFVLIGYFMIGVSIVGLFSFSAYAFPAMRYYGFWLSVVAALTLLVLGFCDDFFAIQLGLTQFQYIAFLISVILILLVGGVLQWIH